MNPSGPRAGTISVSFGLVAKGFLSTIDLHDADPSAVSRICHKNTKVSTLKTLKTKCGMKAGLFDIMRDRHT